MRRLAVAVLALALASAPLHAYNHPELAWKSVNTAHFTVNYYDKTEPAVDAAMKIAESAYANLTQVYGYQLPDKIALSLADYDDYSNGYANWTNGSIMIWVADSRFEWRSNNTWLRNVITHELTHILTMEKQVKLQVLDLGLSLAYLGPTSSVQWVEPFARLTMYPAWFAEGLAQAGSEHEGNDCWDSRRDMLLRCALLDGRQLSLDAMGHFNHDGLGSEMVYNQGFAFVRHLRATIGQEKLSQIVRDGGMETGSFSSIVRKRTGTTLEALYGAWLSADRERCVARAPQHPTPTTPIWTKGFSNGSPRFSPDGARLGWLTNQHDDWYRTDLVIVDSRTLELVARIPYARTAWCFSSDGTTVYYVKARNPNANGSYLNDVFSYSLRTGRETRLTRDARVYDVAMSPDGRSLAVVHYADEAFSLGLLSPQGGRVTPLVAGALGAPFAAPCFDPSDAGALVVTRLVQGKTQLFTLRVSTGESVPLLPSTAQCETPFWGRDGRIYFSADYDGIFNLYSVLPGGGDLRRHTDVVGGLFSPVLDGEGRLVGSEYTSRGFRISRLVTNGAGDPYTIPANHACSYTALPAPDSATRLNGRPYAANFLRPLWEVAVSGILADGDAMGTETRWLGIGALGFSMWRSDALGKKSLGLGLSGGVLAAEAVDSMSAGRVSPFARRELLPRTPLAARDFPGITRPGVRADSSTHTLQAGASLWRNQLWRKAQAAGSSSDTLKTKRFGAAVLQPQFSFESSRLAPTLGVSFDALFLYVIPLFMTASPYATWQLGREVHAGVSPMFSVIPLALAASVDVPFWVQWVHTGYMEKNIDYTLRGVRVLTAQVEPMATSAVDVDTSADVRPSLSASRGIAAAVSFEQGLSLGPSMSVVPSLSVMYAGMAGQATDPMGVLDDTSSVFLSASPRVAFVFPILKQLSRGSFLYADALYGSVFYEGEFNVDGRFLAHTTLSDFGEFARGDQDRSDARVKHTVGFRLQAGLSKSYVFDRMLVLTAGYDLVERRSAAHLSFGF